MDTCRSHIRSPAVKPPPKWTILFYLSVWQFWCTRGFRPRSSSISVWNSCRKVWRIAVRNSRCLHWFPHMIRREQSRKTEEQWGVLKKQSRKCTEIWLALLFHGIFSNFFSSNFFNSCLTEPWHLIFSHDNRKQETFSSSARLWSQHR